MSIRNFRFVCATKVHRSRFVSDTALGRSLTKLAQSNYGVLLFDENSLGLSVVYNRAIEIAKDDPATLIFLHDDVYIADIFWQDTIISGLRQFDIVGLAGNKTRIGNQASWDALDETGLKAASEELSGGIVWGHELQSGTVQYFGPKGPAVKILDGVFLACSRKLLVESGLRFDEQFRFHFYDVDFCREAEMRNIRMGTVPITTWHMGSNTFGTTLWKDGYDKYRRKWGDPECQTSFIS